MGAEEEKGIPKDAKEFKAPGDKPAREPNIIERMEDMDRKDSGLPPVDRSKPRAKRSGTVIERMEELDSQDKKTE